MTNLCQQESVIILNDVLAMTTRRCVSLGDQWRRMETRYCSDQSKDLGAWLPLFPPGKRNLAYGMTPTTASRAAVGGTACEQRCDWPRRQTDGRTVSLLVVVYFPQDVEALLQPSSLSYSCRREGGAPF